MIIVTIIVAIQLAIFLYFKWSFNYWKRMGLTYVKPSIPFGTTENPFNRTMTIGVHLKLLYDQLKQQGHKHAGLYFFTRPEYMVIDPDLIKNILQTDFQYFVDRDHYYNEKVDPLSANLFALGGNKWKALRPKLTPTFTPGKIKYMFEFVLQCSLQMRNAVSKLKNPIDIKDIVSRYTIDVIGTCAFGLNCNSFAHPNAEFAKHGKDIFRPVKKLQFILQSLAFCNPKLGRLLNVANFPKGPTTFFMGTVCDTVKHREENNVQRKDMLQIMIDLKKQNGITIEEIAAQAFIFFIAGFESSSATMTYALYELSKNPDIQDKVRGEVKRVFDKHGAFTYESVVELKYVEQVVEETLRKYPPLPFLTRQCVANYTVPQTDFVIEKGTKIIIPVYGLHHDPEYYPSPERFNPDRFSDGKRGNINPFTYLPFGGGARICLGLRFGLMETKLGLAMLLKDYMFTVNKKTLPLVMNKNNPLLSTENIIYLNAEKVDSTLIYNSDNYTVS